MKKTTYKVIFNRIKKLNKDGKGLVQIECYLEGKRKYLSTGIKVKPVYWDKRINRVKKNHENFILLNRLISQQLKNIEDFEMKYLEKEGFFSLDLFNKLNAEDQYDQTNFINFCRENLQKNASLKKVTRIQHNTVINRLEQFRKNITFRDIDYNFVKEFDSFMRNEGLHINTIANQHKVFKVYINLAIKHKLFSSDDYPYRMFKVKKVQTKRVFLTLDEVTTVENLIFTENTKDIEQVKDMFVFSCYTGLRFSDVHALRNKDIVKSNNEYSIEIRQEKTSGLVSIPVSLLFGGKAVNIIKKYEEDFPEKYLFPRISNQKANLKLKLVALLAKINKVLTFHVSRHTFGTNLAAATSDQFLIKELMGHADIKTSMVYIHTSQEQIRNKLKNTKW